MRASYRKPIGHSMPDRAELSDAVAAVTRDIEARLLAGGLHDIRTWSNACADAGLMPESFAYAEHKLLFKSLVVSAESGQERWSLEFFLNWNWIPTGDIRDAYPFGSNKVEATAFYYMELIPTGIPRYALMIAELRRRREAARKHLWQADQLLSSVFPVHELIGKDPTRVVSAKRVTVTRRGRKAVVSVG